jgi:putative sterol carrier protein
MSEEKIQMADETMKILEKKLNEIKETTEGWGKNMAVVFADIQTGYLMKFALDGTATIERTATSDIKAENVEAIANVAEVTDFKDVLEGNASPMNLLTSGKLKIKGNQGAFMKIAPALM